MKERIERPLCIEVVALAPDGFVNVDERMAPALGYDPGDPGITCAQVALEVWQLKVRATSM